AVAYFPLIGSSTIPHNLCLLPVFFMSDIVIVPSLCRMMRFCLSPSVLTEIRCGRGELCLPPTVSRGREEALTPQPGWFHALTRPGGKTSGESLRTMA